MTNGAPTKTDSGSPPSYEAATGAGQQQPPAASMPGPSRSYGPTPITHGYHQQANNQPLLLDPRSQTAREQARNRAILRFLEAFLWALVIQALAIAIDPPRILHFSTGEQIQHHLKRHWDLVEASLSISSLWSHQNTPQKGSALLTDSALLFEPACSYRFHPSILTYLLPNLASTLQHAALSTPSPAPGSDEHLINRSLLDHLDAHDVVDFPTAYPIQPSADRQLMSSGASLDTSQGAQSAIQQAESLLRDDQPESASLQYQPQPYWGPSAFAGIQAPVQQNSLRHRQSSSNDALRAFGNMNGAIAEAAPNQPYPQELYSSSSTSTIPDGPSFPRNVSAPEFDYSGGHSMQGGNGRMNGTGPPIGNRPNPNTFGPLPVSMPTTFMQQPLQTSSHPLPMIPPQSSNGPQVQNGLLPQHPQMQQMLTAAPAAGISPAAQLAQIIESLPPQKKNAVIGRLQEYAIQGIPPQQSLPPPPAQPVSQAQQPQQAGALSQEDISTIFVVGFPDDITEREFQNMFTFCSGYEAATLKVPPKELTSQPAPNPAVAAAASALAGANDPYNLVTVNSGGVVVDQGNNTAATTSSTWVTGLDDPYTRQALAAAALASSSATTSELAQQLALAQQTQPRKQIIGFAKFRSREEALHARDVLHGRRVDIEKGALLKAEMAKKNLHTKRGVGPMQVALPMGVNGANGVILGPGYVENAMPTEGSTVQALPTQISQESDKVITSSLASMNIGGSNVPSPNDLSASSHALLAAHLAKQPDSPTFKLQRLDEMPSFAGPPPMVNNYLNEQASGYPPFPRNGYAPQQPGNPLLPAGSMEGFHALPNKPVSDVVKANALPPTNLPPPIITSNLGQRNALSNKEASPPALIHQQQEIDAGYMSDALSSRMSERSRSVSVSRYGGYTPPLQQEDDGNVHLPAHLLQDDVLGTPQQTDYASNIFNGPNDYTSAGASGSGGRAPQRKMTDASATVFSPTAEVPAGSSASSAAGSVSSGGAESMSISTTSGIGPGTSDFGRQRQGTMSSVKTANGSNPEQQSRTSGEHHRGRPNAADQNPPINTLYVGNLPTNISTPQQIKMLEDSLQQLFSRCGGFIKLALRQKNNGPMCFVEFDDVPNASKALNDMYGNTLNGLVKGGGIRLSYSKNPLGVRTTLPNGTGNTNRLTSPVQSPTSHGPIQFGNIPPGMQDAGGLVRAGGVPMSLTQPMDMPRGRMRGDTMEMIMGPASPQGRFLPSSPPNGQPGGFGAVGNSINGFPRGPPGMGGPGAQPFVLASSPPSMTPMNMSTYQPSSSYQPFVQLDMTRDLSQQPGYEPGPGV